jgi:hypothetical protein
MRKSRHRFFNLAIVLLATGGISIGIFLIGALVLYAIAAFASHWLFGTIVTILLLGMLGGVIGLLLLIWVGPPEAQEVDWSRGVSMKNDFGSSMNGELWNGPSIPDLKAPRKWEGRTGSAAGIENNEKK